MADILSRRISWRAIGWGGALALLTAPFIAMQLTSEMKWGAGDFLFVGVLLGIIGGLAELGVRASPRWDYRAAYAFALLGGFLVIWANVAVGIVGSEGNPANLWFFAVPAGAMLGAAIVRMKAQGMAFVMFGAAAALMVVLFIAQTGPTDEPWVPAVREVMGTGLFASLFVASGLLFRRAARVSVR